MKTYDFSRGASSVQRALFALWGIVQLVVSSIAFQRGGFAHGLWVLFFGLAAFCAAIFIVYRFNRQRVSIGDVGIVIEMGPTRARAVAWNLVRRIERTGSSVVISLNSGDEVHLLDLVPVGPERADGVDALWEDMRARAEARNVPFDLR